MKHVVLIIFLFIGIATSAQEVSPQLDIAMTFMRQGDYANAVLVLRRAHEEDPGNVSIAKNLALCYYYQEVYKKGLEIIKPFFDKDSADDQCYQIASNLYLQLDQDKEADKLLKKGLKKFPNSGTLYNDLGELQSKSKNADAIKQWESGIEHDPAFPQNYYNAARYYYLSSDKVWCLIYGEIFVNIEPNSVKSAEIKALLTESYKKLFTDLHLYNEKTENNFAGAFLKTMQSQSAIAAEGITTESLTMIRTRFLLDWNNKYAGTYPYHLFDFQTRLLQEGIFDAYNEWLFESSRSLPSYQNWINTHSPEFAAFDRLQKSIVFRMPAGQYYHSIEVKGK